MDRLDGEATRHVGGQTYEYSVGVCHLRGAAVVPFTPASQSSIPLVGRSIRD
jgi:hypothetical protein